MPTALPTMPSPRLNRPVPRMTSATTRGRIDPQDGGADAIENLNRDDQIRTAHQGKKPAAQRQRRKADEQQRPSPPRVSLASDPRGDAGDDDGRNDDAGADQR